jgi:hypothetical protein
MGIGSDASACAPPRGDPRSPPVGSAISGMPPMKPQKELNPSRKSSKDIERGLLRSMPVSLTIPAPVTQRSELIFMMVDDLLGHDRAGGTVFWASICDFVLSR